jgi:hypothetical protein
LGGLRGGVLFPAPVAGSKYSAGLFGTRKNTQLQLLCSSSRKVGTYTDRGVYPSHSKSLCGEVLLSVALIAPCAPCPHLVCSEDDEGEDEEDDEDDEVVVVDCVTCGCWWGLAGDNGMYIMV